MNLEVMRDITTVWKVSKHGVFSGPYFSAFGLNTEGKYSSEKTPYLYTFHAVYSVKSLQVNLSNRFPRQKIRRGCFQILWKKTCDKQNS